MKRLASMLVCCSCVGFHAPGMLDHAVALGPVDLTVQRLYYPETPGDGVMLEYRFGNRTDHGVPLDLGKLQVNIDGRMATLYDPRAEIGPKRLGPQGEGSERIVYLSGRAVPPQDVCVVLNNRCVEVTP